MTAPPFYLVWRDGGNAPARKHKTFDQAHAEACRLAKVSPGDAFYVLAPAMELVVSPINQRAFDLSDFDAVPF